jgi:hypothetical protein
VGLDLRTRKQQEARENCLLDILVNQWIGTVTKLIPKNRSIPKLALRQCYRTQLTIEIPISLL